MKELELWEKILVGAFWALFVLFFVVGALGGIIYLIQEVLVK